MIIVFVMCLPCDAMLFLFINSLHVQYMYCIVYVMYIRSFALRVQAHVAGDEAIDREHEHH